MIPFTPEAILDVGVNSLESKDNTYPPSVIITIGSSLISVTVASSSSPRKLIALIPFFFLVLIYSSSGVFLTNPFFVTNNTYFAFVSL